MLHATKQLSWFNGTLAHSLYVYPSRSLVGQQYFSFIRELKNLSSLCKMTVYWVFGGRGRK